MQLIMREYYERLITEPSIINLFECSEEEYVTAICHNSECFEYVPKLKLTIKIIDTALNKNPELIKHVPNSFLENPDLRETLKYAFSSNGLSLGDVSNRFDPDRELVELAIKSNPYVCTKLKVNQMDDELFKIALFKEPTLVIDKEFIRRFGKRIPKEAWEIAVNTDDTLIRHMPESLITPQFLFSILTKTKNESCFKLIKLTSHLSSNNEALDQVSKTLVILEQL